MTNIFCGAAVQLGPGPPHYSCLYKVVQIWPGQTVTCLHTNSPGHIWTTLYITIRRTHPAELLFPSDQLVADAASCITQHLHFLTGFLTRDLSSQAASDVRFRPQSHRDRPCSIYVSLMITIEEYYSNMTSETKIVLLWWWWWWSDLNVRFMEPLADKHPVVTVSISVYVTYGLLFNVSCTLFYNLHLT